MGSWRHLYSYETFVKAISGSYASCTSMFVFYPLDTVRCRLQIEDDREAKNTFSAIKEIVEKEGCESLYRGLHPVLISLAASGFVYFYSFHGLRTAFSNNQHSPLKDLLFGSIAGVINIALTAPLWVVNTRIKMQKSDDPESTDYKGIVDGLVKISREEGFRSLWAGSMPSLLLVSNPAIQFATYELLKNKLCRLNNRTTLPGSVYLLIGAMAKSLATLITYPLQIIQTKLRNGNLEMQNMSILQALVHQFKSYGLKGLYNGLECKLWQTVLSTALMYLTYEKLTNFIFNLLISHHNQKHI